MPYMCYGSKSYKPFKPPPPVNVHQTTSAEVHWTIRFKLRTDPDRIQDQTRNRLDSILWNKINIAARLNPVIRFDKPESG